ncbi:MAG: hypothetical protein B6242_10980 [Anaerolineaceae bacterium 4572_78]|nr:MAG: hypothetical protein B6242_10980 [Anaerolineaceae bacterium 4572_78]
MNRSDSQAGVLRGLHYHHHQVDYWYVIQGSMRAGLADIRPESATYLAQQVIDINEDNRIGLFIPIGVAHGFFALTEVSLMYVVDNYYDGTDEHGVAWNDPQLNVNWGIENPIISKRDMGNPFLKDIPPENLGAVK